MDGYVERLVSEILSVNSRMGGRPYVTAFIGGGNPGCLGPERLGRIARAVCANGRPSEFSVEMNPESLSESYFPLFESCFTRLSMGIQSLDPQALAFLGRNANLDSTRRGLELSQSLRAQYGTALSYDLITCLGSWHDELSDVGTLVSKFSPDHLSVYALTLEEGTPLWRRKPDLPDSDEQYEILKRVWTCLEECGYEHYEVSNFAREGHWCEHNCRYWAYEQYLGLGPGAASTAFGSDGSVTRFSFDPDVSSYCSTELFSGFESESLTPFEASEELVFMGLRYKRGLDLSRLEALSGKKVPGNVLERGIGFEVVGENLVPNEEGLMLSDAEACAIIDALS